MILEKVYDELIGMIEDLQKKIGSGASTVMITPTLESGTKVADYTIDETSGTIYAPTPPAVQNSNTAKQFSSEDVPTGQTIDSVLGEYVNGNYSSEAGTGWCLYKAGKVRILYFMGFTAATGGIDDFIPSADAPVGAAATGVLWDFNYNNSTPVGVSILGRKSSGVGKLSIFGVTNGVEVAPHSLRGFIVWSVSDNTPPTTRTKTTKKK